MIRQAWARLVHKQFLFLYPLALGVLDAAAFFAVYASLHGPLNWGEFTRANFAAGTFLRGHLDELVHPGLAMIVALASGALLCLLTAAIRAPFYRAIAGPSYPFVPRTATELLRLTLFYLVSYPVIRILPSLFDENAGVWTAAGTIALLVVSLLLVYTDYIIVLEDMPAAKAVSRGIRLLRRGLLPTVLFYLAFNLLYSPIWNFFSSHYEGNFRMLFPIAQLLVDALFVLVGDIVFIFLFDHIRRS